ncbi:MAG: hypothetical protein GVY04_05035 [Cyanobacteria bacterium]|jgi:hypothetical protein|nr:hypothetical protein [Cyanobacteria bacterium GSL.Bin1]
MASQMSEADLAKAREKLPPSFLGFKDQYPVSLTNAVDEWDTPPYPEGYIPHSVDVYFQEDALGPDLIIEAGKLKSLNFDAWADSPDVIVVEIDDQFAYIQLEGRVILDRLGGVVLPDVFVDPELLLKEAQSI